MEEYGYGTTYTAAPNSEIDAAIGMGILLFILVILLITYIINSIFLGKIFKKASVDSWIAWVPFYNNWKLLEIGGQKGFWAILGIIPVVNVISTIYLYIAMYNIGKKLGKDDAFVVLAVLVQIVWIIILGVDKSTWNEATAAPRLDRPTPPQQPATETPKNL